MQFYLFKESCATKETGPEYPQVQKWKTGYDDDKHDSYYSYYYASSKGRIFPDFIPDLDALVMQNRAKPTDLISSGLSIGFIISDKLKAIIQQFKFPPYRLYPVKILHKKVELDGYYFMHIISDYFHDYLEFVDYCQSTFSIAKIDRSNAKPISLTSKQDYLNKAKELQDDFSIRKSILRRIYAEKICFNKDFANGLDCFIAPFGIDYYISQDFKNVLIEDKITGCNIQATDRILIKS